MPVPSILQFLVDIVLPSIPPQISQISAHHTPKSTTLEPSTTFLSCTDSPPTYPRTLHPQLSTQNEAQHLAAGAVYSGLGIANRPSVSLTKHNCTADHHSRNRTCRLRRASATATSKGSPSRPVPLQHDLGVVYHSTRPTIPFLFLLGERWLFSVA